MADEPEETPKKRPAHARTRKPKLEPEAGAPEMVPPEDPPDGDVPPSLHVEGEQRPGTSAPASDLPDASGPGQGGKLAKLLFGDKKKPTDKIPEAKVPKGPAAKRARRKSLADPVAFLYGGVGSVMVRSGSDIPVGRAMELWAPVVGEKADAVLAGSIIDKLCQPLLSKGEDFSELVQIMALPFVVGAMERRPELEATLTPILYALVETNIVAMAEVFEKKRKREAEVKKVVAQAFPDIPEGVDPVMEIIGMLFAPPEHAAPEQEPAAASSAA